VGLASFVKALSRLGRTMVLAAPLARTEWVRRVDGAFLAPWRTGLLMASAFEQAAFVGRATDAAGAERATVTRAAALVALFEARRTAAELSMPGGAEEADALWLGRPLPRGSFGLWPTPRDDAAARFLAWLDHPAQRASAQDLFDEDWFRNPRSRSWLMLPPDLPTPDLDAWCTRLVRHFERACG
jgi:hypothetical protein